MNQQPTSPALHAETCCANSEENAHQNLIRPAERPSTAVPIDVGGLDRYCLHCGERWECTIAPCNHYYCLECGAIHWSNHTAKLKLSKEQPDFLHNVDVELPQERKANDQ